MSEKLAQIVVVVSGRVQGVGFRAWTRSQAVTLGIAGWVKNRNDGAVEVVCEGKRELLDRFVSMLRDGPVLARVDQALVSERPCTGSFSGFNIIYCPQFSLPGN